MADTSRLIELTVQQLRAVNHLTVGMRPATSSPQRLMCALFLTMVEQFEAATRLLQARLPTHAAVHVRAMIEALAHYRCLATKATHITVMKYKQARGEKEAYEEAIASGALLPADLNLMRDRLANCLERIKAIEAELPKKERRPPIPKILKDADIGALIAPYTLLCSLAHSDITALALRHQGVKTMEIRKQTPLEVEVLVHTMAHYCIIFAVRTLPDVAWIEQITFTLNYPAIKSIHADLLEECESLRKKAAG